MEALLAEADWVRRIACSLLRDEGAALDLSQDVLHAAVVKRPALRGPRLRAWLVTVARRKVARRLERERARPHVEEQAAVPEVRDTDEAARRVQLHVDLAAEIQGLAPEDRRLLVAHYLEGRTQVDLARSEGLAPAALRKRLSRARTRLRQRLDASERGREGWTLALGFLGREFTGSAVPLPVETGGGPVAAAKPALATPALFLSIPLLAALMKFALVLVAVATVAFWLWPLEAPSLRSDSVIPAPTAASATVGVDRAGVDRAGMEPPAAAVSMREATVAEGDPAAPLTEEAAIEPSRFVRIVDEGLLPMAEARAVWIAKDGLQTRMTLDEDGYAATADAGAGRLLVAAPGYQGRWLELEESDRRGRGEARVVMLPVAPVLTGRVTVDGVAPGRVVRFWEWRLPKHLGLKSHESGEEKLERWLGIEDRPMPEADENGHFRMELFWAKETICLRLPSRFVLRSLNGEITGGDSVEWASDVAEITMDLAELPAVTGRLEWSDDGSPVTGLMHFMREDARGTTLDGMRWEPLTPSGEFAIPALIRPEDLELLDLEPFGSLARAHQIELSLESGAPEFSHLVVLEGQDLFLDLGTIRVQRHPEFQVLVREAASDGSEQKPIRAAIRAGGAHVSTGADGRATVRMDPDGALEVFAIGYRAASVPLSPGLLGQEVLVEMQPGTTLRVSLPSLPRGPAQPLVLLEWDDTPFETAYLDEERKGQPYSLSIHQRLQSAGFLGGGWSHAKPGAPGDASFPFPRDGDLLIGCLLPGRDVRVQLVDRLRQPLVTVPVTLEMGESHADLRPGWRDHALALEVRVMWEDGTPVSSGWVQLVGSADWGESFGFEAGHLRLDPLARGTYPVEVFATGAKTHRVQFELSTTLPALDIVLERE
ncbi:RNA polymerase sigma factor [Saltatorellus ferox]